MFQYPLPVLSFTTARDEAVTAGSRLNQQTLVPNVRYVDSIFG